MLALLNFTHFVSKSGYAAVFVLSVLQSCCVPTGSELYLGFAGAITTTAGAAALVHGSGLNLFGVIAAGVGGELLGAIIAYYIGKTGGRAIVDRYGKYVLMTHADLDKAEAWYERHGSWAVFVGRLIPVVRNFVAVPAGVAEVPIVRFVGLTALGSLVWVGGLTLIGRAVGSSYHNVTKKFSYAGYVLAAVAVAAIAFAVWHRYRAYKTHTAAATRD